MQISHKNSQAIALFGCRFENVFPLAQNYSHNTKRFFFLSVFYLLPSYAWGKQWTLTGLEVKHGSPFLLALDGWFRHGNVKQLCVLSWEVRDCRESFITRDPFFLLAKKPVFATCRSDAATIPGPWRELACRSPAMLTMAEQKDRNIRSWHLCIYYPIVILQ